MIKPKFNRAVRGLAIEGLVTEGDHSGFDLQSRLIDKSIEAYVLALETINRLTIQYRLEASCYLLCNAWELLLKAKLLEGAINSDIIYYNQPAHKPRRSLSLHDCLKKVMPGDEDPMRRNRECIEDLRDEAVHLVIHQIPLDIISLFQAGVINYHKRLFEWFNRSLADRYPVGMMNITYGRRPEEWDMSSQVLRNQLGFDSFEFLSTHCAELKKEHADLQNSTELFIGIEYRLVLTKKDGQADISLTSGVLDVDPTQIVEVAKDSSISHPHRQKEVIELLKMDSQIYVNPHDCSICGCSICH